MLLVAAVFFCMGGSLEMLLCQIQDAMRQAEDVSATDLRAAGSPVCAGLCVCVMSPVNVFMIVLQRGCNLSGIPLSSMNNGRVGFHCCS